MALDKKDFDQIGKRVKKIVDSSAVNIKEEVKADLNREIGSLRLDMNQRFDATDKKIDKVEYKILGKIGEIKKMESEDIAVVYDDIAMIKKRLPA